MLIISSPNLQDLILFIQRAALQNMIFFQVHIFSGFGWPYIQFRIQQKNEMTLCFYFWHLRHLPSIMPCFWLQTSVNFACFTKSSYRPSSPQSHPHPPPADLRIDLPQEHCLTLQTFTVPLSPSALCTFSPLHLDGVMEGLESTLTLTKGQSDGIKMKETNKNQTEMSKEY